MFSYQSIIVYYLVNNCFKVILYDSIYRLITILKSENTLKLKVMLQTNKAKQIFLPRIKYFGAVN